MSETAIVLADEKNKLFPALQSWATALSNLAPEQVPAALDMARQMKNLSEEVHDKLRDKLLEGVKKNGVVVTAKGSLQDTVGGFKVIAIPTRTGVDAKKFEAMLRAKKVEPSVHMDSTITLKFNQTKADQAVGAGVITQADLDSCKYDPAFRVSVERE